MTTSAALSGTERRALADLLAELGPDRPTCCEGWTTAHLAAHLVVRDRRPDAMPGFVVGGPVGAWSRRVQDRTRIETDWPVLVEQVRTGPPRWSPTAWPAADRAFNTAEMAVHHEDVRRAQPGWEPRQLPRAVHDELWANVPFLARAAQRGRPGSLLFRRSDVPGTEKRVGSGEPTTTVTGQPMELLLWAGGREDVARVTVSAA